MADPPPYPDTHEDTGVRRARRATTGSSRWQKVVGIIGLVVVVLAIGIVLFRVGFAGDHDPGKGTPGGNQEQQTGTDTGGEHTPPPWVPDHK
jgi:hypothetical protein